MPLAPPVMNAIDPRTDLEVSDIGSFPPQGLQRAVLRQSESNPDRSISTDGGVGDTPSTSFRTRRLHGVDAGENGA
jgi:hypothetical protein